MTCVARRCKRVAGGRERARNIDRNRVWKSERLRLKPIQKILTQKKQTQNRYNHRSLFKGPHKPLRRTQTPRKRAFLMSFPLRESALCA